jgi:hypothetical protein
MSSYSWFYSTPLHPKREIDNPYAIIDSIDFRLATLPGSATVLGQIAMMSAPSNLVPGKGTLGLILLITLLAFALRFFHLADQSLWTDELSSINVARAPLNELCELAATKNNSLPTYFLLLSPLAREGATDPELRVRFPSALAGALSIPVFIWVVFLWRQRWDIALTAGALLAINPLHLWYSQEARAYSLMLFFGLLCLLGYELRRRRAQTWAAALYWGSGLVALAFHKTAMVFPVTCMLLDAWALALPAAASPNPASHSLATRPNQRSFLGLILFHLPILLGILGVLSLKSYPPPEAYRRAASLLEIPYALLTYVGGYSLGPSLTEIQFSGAVRALLSHPGQIAAAGAGLGLLFLLAIRHRRRVFGGPELLLAVLGMGIVVASGLITGFPFNVRYTLPALLGFLALAAVLSRPAAHSTSNPSWPTRLLFLTLLGLSLQADAQWFWRPEYRKADSRRVARWLVENRQQIRSWTLLPGYLTNSVVFYLSSETNVLNRHLHPREDRTTSFPPTPDALILGRRHHIQDPDELIRNYRAAAGPLQTNLSIPGFEIFTAQPSSNAPEGGGNDVQGN